ncbi:formate C-acetyltransferase [candidate division FCPU426 bacterium]|nr:formate C-acetyltransferase [candidate division FCPU426 bacterium]
MARQREAFKRGRWCVKIDLQDFIYRNYTPYEEGPDFLQAATPRTKKVWRKVAKLMQEEQERGGVLDIDVNTPSGITTHAPGYIDKANELIVGLQTDKPLRRAIKPVGGIRLVEKACAARGVTLNPRVIEIYTKYRTSHNDAVFAIYTEEMKTLRRLGIITGLPDNYARGRIIGDYRRVALYGINRLITEKQNDLLKADNVMDTKNIRWREEISSQIKALEEMIALGRQYGVPLQRPAVSAREAIQWTYLAYLAAAKESDGAAMSIGHLSAFFDIYLSRYVKAVFITDRQAQELIDAFTIKLRLIRQLRAPEYDQIFAGDPVWITLVLGGMASDGRTKVTKTDYRFLQSLRNLGSAPEPNLTVLYSPRLPEPWKTFVSEVAIHTSSLQFENDDLMRPIAGDDYGISCCVSLLKAGNQIQYFGARCNLAKALLLALNEGRDEIFGEKVVPNVAPLRGKYLNYDQVHENFVCVLSWLAGKYVNIMNVIHWSHDRYYYEAAQMALLDSELDRLMAFGIAGLSVVVDSLCAIRYTKVEALRDQRGLTRDFKIKGEYPAFGNDDERADNRARDLIITFITELRKHPIYRRANPTLSILTITSNVLYGKKTGATPDGRKKGEPFAPGANPMYGREKNGVLASLNSISKLPYYAAQDGISNTFSIVPQALGRDENTRSENLIGILDGYFTKGGHHINVNVLDRALLKDAMRHPEKYPQLTIRVSGYAVHFTKLSQEHQEEILRRTFHEMM